MTICSIFSLCLAVQQITRTQDLPGADTLNVRPEFFDDIQDVSLISDTMAAYVTRACPSGIERCECMNAPGKEKEMPEFIITPIYEKKLMNLTRLKIFLKL